MNRQHSHWILGRPDTTGACILALSLVVSGCLFSSNETTSSGPTEEPDASSAKDVAPDTQEKDVLPDQTDTAPDTPEPKLVLEPKSAQNLYYLSIRDFELTVKNWKSQTCPDANWSVSGGPEGRVSVNPSENNPNSAAFVGVGIPDGLLAAIGETPFSATLKAACPAIGKEVTAPLRVKDFPTQLVQDIGATAPELWLNSRDVETRQTDDKTLVELWPDRAEGPRTNFEAADGDFGSDSEPKKNQPETTLNPNLIAPIVRFDGDGDILKTKEWTDDLSSSSFTAFLVFQPQQVAGKGQLVAGCGDGAAFYRSGIRYNMSSDSDPSTRLEVSVRHDDDTLTDLVLPVGKHLTNGNWTFLTVRFTGLTAEVYGPGKDKLASDELQGVSNPGKMNFGINALGRNCKDLDGEFYGGMAEVLYFPSALSADDRKAVQDYVRSRYRPILVD